MADAIAAAAYWVGSAISSLIPAGASSGVVAFGSAAAYAGYGAVYVGLTAAVSYGVSELTRPDSGSLGGSQGRELQLQVDPTFPRQMCIGRRLVAGSMVAHYSCGNNRERLHLVVPLVDHPVQQCARVFGDGRLVYNTPLVHGVRTEIPWDDRIGGLVYMTFWDGRPGQTYDGNLVSESAIEPDVVAGRKPGWTTAHVGAGIAWVHIELGYNTNVMTSMPSFLFDLVGAGLYDRRLDSTAGGSGAHRINDPSTWLEEWSDNPATALDHFLLGIKVEDDDLAFGVGLRADDVPYAAMAAAADLSDEDMVTGEGAGEATIKRYRANGVVSASDTFEDVIEALQLQMGARLVDYGGRIGIVPAEERTPVCSLSDGDWVTDDSVSYTDRRTFDDLVGGVEGRFADPSNVYQPTPYEAQVAPEASFADGGEAATRTLELPFEVNPRRAARLARIWLERERRQARLSGTFTFAAWELEPGDWFSYSSTHEQLEDELFEVLDIVKNADFSVTLTAQAVDAGIVAFDNDNDPDLSEPVYLEPVSLWLDTPEFEVEATTLEAGAIVEPALLFTLTSDDPLAREIVIERAQWDAGASELVGPSIYSVHHSDDPTTVLRTGILPSTAYKVRCKSRAGSRESDWAEWSAAVTTGASYTVGGATSVPWTGVTNPTGTRPDDNADVTIDNTAAGFLGQGALAVLSSLSFGGAYITNRLLTNLFRADGTTAATESMLVTALGVASAISGQGPWATTSTAVATVLAPRPNLFPHPSGDASGAAATALGWLSSGGDTSGSGLLRGRYDPYGGPIYIEAWPSGYSSAGYRVHYRDIPCDAPGDYTVSQEGAFAGFAASTCVFRVEALNAEKSSTLATSSTVAITFGQRASATVAAPSGSAWLRVLTIINPQTVGAYCNLCLWSIKIEPGNVATPFRNERTDADLGADVTLDNTAAAFAGQGALATLSSLANGGPYLSGFGGLSALAYVTFGSNVRRSDGSTSATDADYRTALGTASAISGQGAFATLSTADYGSGLLTGFGGLAALAYVTFGSNIRRADGSTSATDGDYRTALGTASAISGQGSFATVSSVAYGSGLLTGFGSLAALSSISGLTAGGISGQGALATLNSLAYGGSYLTGFGGLAALAYTTLGTNVRREDGSTAVTDAAAITSLGTASGIAGQGALATLGQVNFGASGRVYRDDGTTRVTDAISITALGTASAIAGQGAFATLSSAAYGSSLLTGFGSLATLSSAAGLTAGGIVGQGSFATLSSVAYGSSYLTGFGGLAALAFTTIGTDVRRADGSTVATEAMVVTSLGTASAISAQGALATLSSVSYGSAYVSGFGSLAALSSAAGLTAGAITGQGPWATEGTAVASITAPKPNLVSHPSGTGTGAAASTIGWLTSGGAAGSGFNMPSYAPYGGPIFNEGWASGYSSGSFRFYYRDFPIVAGSAYTYSLASATGLTGCFARIELLNSARDTAYGFYDVAISASGARVAVTHPGHGSAAWARAIVIIPPQTTAASYVDLSFWQLKLEPGSAATPFQNERADVEAGANVTETRTASAISGQGGLATLSFVQLGSNVRLADGTTVASNAALVTSLGTASGISGQGSLATSNFVLFSSTVRLADGTTVVTDAMVVTSAGVASAITSQGTQATANHQRGATYSGSPAEGSWWADTASNTLKLYTGGAWYTVSNIATPLVVTISDTLVSSSRPQGPSRNTDSLTVSVSGGTTPYTYKWRSLATGGFDLTASAPTAATTYWSGPVIEGQVINEEWECVVTDANKSSAFVRCNVELFDGDWEG